MSAIKQKWGNETAEWQKAEALIIANRTNIYTYIINENVHKENTKSHTYVFNKDWHFLISLNFTQGASDLINWAKTINSTLAITYPTLIKGEVFVCARFGSEWQGMKIRKK